MDSIEVLPNAHGYNSILAVVDCLTKQAIFIPTTDKMNSEELACLFLIHVYSKHGVPQHITSNRGSEFMSKFTQSLGELLDMKLHFTSGYHPSVDGQTERTNQTLEQYIRTYCAYQQDDWDQLLPLAEFAYNSAPSSSTGVSPFFANKGYQLRFTVYPERHITNAHALNFAVDLDSLHEFLHAQLSEAREQHKESVNRRLLDALDIPVGSQAYILTKYITMTRPTRKFSEVYLGPFEVLGRPNPNSVQLRLPNTLCGIHPVFPISQVEPHTSSAIPGRTNLPPPPVEVDGEPEYEVAAILNSKIDKRCRWCPLHYLVRWSGYEGTAKEEDWVAATDLTHCQELVDDYHTLHPSKPGPST